MSQFQPIRRALLSLSDKTGLIEFAQGLVEHGVELLSTGGTFKQIQAAGLPVTEVADYTGFAEMMDGRVKTLHPKIHGGILGREQLDAEVMAAHGIGLIDLVVVNLYPFAATVSQPDVQLDDAIENIDIGGPAMVRSAAKNHARVSILTDVSDYQPLLNALAQGGTTLAQRFQWARKAFAHTAAYDGMIANWLGSVDASAETLSSEQRARFPLTFNRQLHKRLDLRYGENPHQHAAFYVDAQPSEASVATAVQLQGKELSFNNIADTDAALECVKSFDQPACVIVKHANPCGVAVRQDIASAYDAAYQTDPTSAFGGIIAFNRELDALTASRILERQFVEVVIAPAVSAEAQAIFASKPNVRLLSCGQWQASVAGFDYKPVNGGLLVQDRDLGMIDLPDLKIVTKVAPSADQLVDLLFAWKVAKFVKSNAIVYANQQQSIGIGAGQMSRVYSAKIAGIKAADEGLEVPGSVMASDAFFPFRDGLDQAAAAGIKAVIQPGGSMRDAEVIAAADEHGIAMVFTGMRHFRH